MSDPPEGQERFDGRSFAPQMRTIGAVTFSVASMIYGLKIFTRLHVTRMAFRVEDCELHLLKPTACRPANLSRR